MPKLQTKSLVSTRRESNTPLDCDVRRGPNWLFVKLHHPEASTGAEQWVDELWQICERHFTYRLVVEMDEVGQMSPHITEELHRLDGQLHAHGGALRLCRMSQGCENTVTKMHYSSELRNHRSLQDAVLGCNAS